MRVCVSQPVQIDFVPPLDFDPEKYYQQKRSTAAAAGATGAAGSTAGTGSGGQRLGGGVGGHLPEGMGRCENWYARVLVLRVRCRVFHISDVLLRFAVMSYCQWTACQDTSISVSD